MREIKFRAWFPKDHYSKPHMSYLDIDDDFGGASATWQLRYLQHPEPYGPIYMQYTGLKDKNGVEIYEGDLLKTLGGNKVVGFALGGFVLQARSGKSSVSYIAHPGDYEVIGNIYENKDLLKNKVDK